MEEGGGRILEGEGGTEVLSGGVEGEVSRHTVFNAEQADGLPSPPSRFPEPDWKAHLRADNLIRASGVSIDHRNAGQVYYSLERDRIVLPPPHAVRGAAPLLPGGGARDGSRNGAPGPPGP